MMPGECVVGERDSFPKRLEVFQDQTMYIHMYAFMHIVYTHICGIDVLYVYSMCYVVLQACGKGQCDNVSFSFTVLCPAQDQIS